MQTSTLVILACVLAVVAAAHFEHAPASSVEDVYESVYDTPAHDNSPRTKRGLLLLKKKLLLGALGLKAVKVGAVGAGVAGAIALKSKAGHKSSQTVIELHSKPHVHHAHHISSHGHGVPQSFVDVHNWSG